MKKEQPQTHSQPVVKKVHQGTAEIKAVIIGVSTGGPKALSTLLPDLCQRISIPVLIVQHMPENFTRSLAEHLNKKCSSRVTEAIDGEQIVPNVVYIAPGGSHMLVSGTSSMPRIKLNNQPPENGCRPSVDVLFRSAATHYGAQCIACILTGMGQDGVRGMRSLKQSGAITLAQDEESSVVWGMPGSAVENGVADEILPLVKFPERIAQLITNT